MMRRMGLVLVGLGLAMGFFWLPRFATSLGRHSAAAPPATQFASRTTPTPGLAARSDSTRSPRPGAPRPVLRRRRWDAAFLGSLAGSKSGDRIRFELVDGAFAQGRVLDLRRTRGQVTYVFGELTQPAPGRFFFQKQTMPGVAGDYAGVVLFDNQPIAYRVEPTGTPRVAELVKRPVEAVVCRQLPKAPPLPSPPVAELPPLNPGDFPNLPIPGYQHGIVVLESLHGAAAVIYLDFEGGYTAAWGGITYARPNVSNAQIRDVWQRVAEDFMPFNINVTTDLAVYQSAPQNSRQRVIITPTTTVAAEAGGVALIGSFNWTVETPCWVFILGGKACAEACSHEAGHSLGLTHEGQEYGGQLFEYYAGHGTGPTSWAPIMGLPYSAAVTQWSKGEYLYSDNGQDELAIISSQNNNVAYRPDDTGDTLATARYLELYPDQTAWAEGVIERTGDTDAFRFSTGGGAVRLRADPVSVSPNLAVAAALYDQADVLVASSNPQDTLSAEIATNVPEGTYTFRVTGADRNDPLTNGFSSYASLGYYSITGSVANAQLPDRFSVPEHAPNGTVLGVIPVANTSDAHLFQIKAGNAGNTFSLDGAGVLSVANNAMLDYDVLAAKTQFPVQFELFVDLIDKVDPSLTETNRRVVVAVIYVPTPPAIQVQPGDVTVPAGSNPSLVLSALGDQPLSYQWFFQGLPVVGSAGPALAFSDVQQANAGAYYVVVTNWLGAVTSTVAHLEVTPAAPLVSRQPQAQGTALGFSASFSAAAAGTEPLSYAWQRDGLVVPGADQASLLLPDVTPQLTGLYRLVVSNEVGTSFSDEALLVLEPVAEWGHNDQGQTRLYPDLTNAVELAAGPDFSLALLRNGRVFAWGAAAEMPVPADLTNAMQLSAGGAHALALRADGTIMSWGTSGSGSPGQPIRLTDVVAVAAGGAHDLALLSSGRVVGWGLNTSGQANVPFLTNAVAIAAGSNHSLALGADGKVRAWGDNTFGQTQVPTSLANVVAIAAGARHSLALLADGTVAGWGDNRYGQATIPAGLSGIVEISAGAFHSLAVDRAGNVFAWGAGQTNTGVDPQFGQSAIPAQLRPGTVSAAAGGGAHTLVFAGDVAPFVTHPPVDRAAYTGQRVIFWTEATGGRPLSYQWQHNGSDLVGATDQLLVLPQAWSTDAGQYRAVVANQWGAVTSRVASLTLKPAAPVIAVQPAGQQPLLGGQITLEVSAYGTEPFFYQWRFNGADVLGATDATLALDHLARAQSGYYSVVVSNALGEVSSGKAKISVMQVVAWGAGTNYVGPNAFGQSLVPAGLDHVWRLAGGSYHSLALEDAGRVAAWGAGTNLIGSSGFNTGQSVVPDSLNQITSIAAGTFHSLALRSDGMVFAWGASSEQAKVPDSLSNVIAIAAGKYHSVALRRDGRPVVWATSSNLQITNPPLLAVNLVAVDARGNQIVGVRGDGTVVRWGTPNFVPAGLSGVIDVAAGANHALALKSDGTVAALDPGFAPPLGLSNVVQISAGSGFSLALRTDGTLFAWGPSVAAFGVSRVPALSAVGAIACGDYHCLAALGDATPSICVQPTSRQVTSGDRMFLRVGATGQQPLHFQWYFNDALLLNATGAVLQLGPIQTNNAGNYYAVASSQAGAITSSVASITLVGGPDPAAIALNQTLSSPGLAWSSGGDQPWFGQTNVQFAGRPAAQTGRVSDNQQSWVQTTVSGPGSLSFWWKVSSEEFFDLLNFYIDGTLQASLSGEVDWQPAQLDITSGTHVLRWTYQKDATLSAGADSGWLSQVNFIPQWPRMVTQPLGQTSSMGATILLSGSVIGAPPLTFGWLKDGALLPGAAAASLLISNATRHNSGRYQMLASNLSGAVTSAVAPVLVLVPQRLLTPVAAGGSLLLQSADADGAVLLANDLTGFHAQISTNLIDWFDLPATDLQLTNGMLWLSPSLNSTTPAAFYRMLERSQ